MPVNAKSFFSRPDFQIRLASLLGALTLVLVGILLTLSIGASLFRWAFVNSRAGDLLSGAYGMFAFMIPLYLFWAAWLLANPAFKPGSIFLLSSTIIPFLTLAAGFSFIKDFETRRNAWNFLDSLGRPGLGLLVITAAILEAAGILILHAFFFNNGMDPAGARLSPSEERRYSPPDSRRVLPEQRRSPPGEDWSAPKTRPQEAPPPAPPRSMEIAADTAGPAEETPLSAEASPARETFLKPRRAAGEEKPVELPEWKPLASAAALEELETLRNEPAPVEKTPAMNEASFIEKTPPVEKTPPLEETPLPLEEAALVEETLPVEETPIMEETPLVEETLPLEEAAPVEETLSLKETPLVEETSLLEEIAPVEETPSPVEETLPVEEAALVEAPPLGAIPPMEEPAPPAAEPLPVEEPLPPEEEVVVLSPAILTPYSRIAALDPGVEVEISAASEQGEEPDPAEPSGEELEDLEFAAEDPELEPELAMADPELELKPEPGLESAVEPVPCEPAAILSAPEEIPAPAVPAIVKKAPPKKCKSPYAIPVEGILNQYPDGQYWIIDEETNRAAQTLRETLSEFGIQAEVTGIRKGPVITMFEMLPAPGVKLSKIVNLQDNIALRLAASSVRIVAPIPGKHAVGIEVPNKKRSIVSFREIIEGELGRKKEGRKPELPVVLGKDITGEAVTVDLTQMPHLLIAGSTGSGKSVCVNSMILSILYQLAPAECRLILIDPKIVELKLYNDIPHLLTPVITEPKRAFQALQYCIYEMERRYACLDSMGVRDIRSYNRRIKERNIAVEHIPYIVVVIDEFADLMATTGKELEGTVARLAAMSRAVGIHLVLATQRPSIDVITGLIKANIPSRIAFMVASKMDSRIIIDMVGAEKLLGKGDMLYAGAVDPFPIRMQGAFISEEEVERVVEYVKTLGEPEYIDDEIFYDEEDDDPGISLFSEGEDPLYDKALEVVIQQGKASASYIQRRLKIGYNRAARLVEEMEHRGVVGPAQGSRPRELLRTA